MSGLSHLDEEGRARMVDVSGKPDSLRIARASASLACKGTTIALVREQRAPKGNVIAAAELAGVMAAKRTAELIPMCHPLMLTKAEVLVSMDDALPGFRICSEVRTTGPTGVEMEALTAVSVAALTLYDMLKAVDRSMEIGGIRLLAKSGGRSGDWTAE